VAGPGTGFDANEPWRSDFRKDCARLIHCASFRRLVGKTQLFSAHESDFFRNRLTHSLEVAQIAKSIAMRLNAQESFIRGCGEINTDLVEVAALAHDLRHPPFGHNGELALDFCMRNFGGFEGNAQTLRILSRLEKKVTTDPLAYGVTDGGDDRSFGLDLCARTLAAVLKYDQVIPARRRKKPDDKVTKGYYRSEQGLVRRIKLAVTGRSAPGGKFKTIECQIMDIADDIAYSTYDLEDAFKAGFLTPIQLLAADIALLDQIAASIRTLASAVGKNTFRQFSGEHVRGVLLYVFGVLVEDEKLERAINENRAVDYNDIIKLALRSYTESARMAQVGYVRTQVTAKLVGAFIAGVKFSPNAQVPALSSVELQENTWLRVEVLKRFCYSSLIMSSRLRVAEQRGKEIVREVFDCLTRPGGHQLLPEDFRNWHEKLRTKAERMRVICDFIAGMTDRYAVEFHARLKSETPQTIFKPL